MTFTVASKEKVPMEVKYKWQLYHGIEDRGGTREFCVCMSDKNEVCILVQSFGCKEVERVI